jgi:hypothetical protein
LTTVFFNPPKAQAQAAATAPAPGGVSMVVTAGNNAGNTTSSVGQIQGGVITMQDSVNRKVTVVAYSYVIVNSATTAPTILLSPSASFSY